MGNLMASVHLSDGVGWSPIAERWKKRNWFNLQFWLRPIVHFSTYFLHIALFWGKSGQQIALKPVFDSCLAVGGSNRSSWPTTSMLEWVCDVELEWVWCVSTLFLNWQLCPRFFPLGEIASFHLPPSPLFIMIKILTQINVYAFSIEILESFSKGFFRPLQGKFTEKIILENIFRNIFGGILGKTKLNKIKCRICWCGGKAVFLTNFEHNFR